ncbi:hypothetical protein IH992_19785 [Candidatus Poribacteria bacterium]|nr:hypothetical protein [Candidatus Poribacteria bacterium]
MKATKPQNRFTGSIYTPRKINERNVIMATTLDNHSGLEFTSGGVDYLGLELLEHEDGVGTIWLAIPKNHDLDIGPVTPVIVLAPDTVDPT